MAVEFDSIKFSSYKFAKTDLSIPKTENGMLNLLSRIKVSVLSWYYTRKIFKFILKRGFDPATFAARDTDIEDLAKEAVHDYINEKLVLLPRRYKLILSELQNCSLLSDQELDQYTEDVWSVIEPDGQVATFNEETGHMEAIMPTSSNPPWVDRPDLKKQISEKLAKKISDFESDLASAQKDSRGFALTLSHLTSKGLKR